MYRDCYSASLMYLQLTLPTRFWLPVVFVTMFLFCGRKKGKEGTNSVFANCKSMTTQRKTPAELVKPFRNISKERSVEDVGLHLGLAYTVRGALNMSGASAPEGRNHAWN